VQGLGKQGFRDILPLDMPALLRIFKTVPGLADINSAEAKEVVNPEDYLSAGGELLLVCIAQAWVLAWFFSWDNVRDNPLKDLIGYNNVCVAWDVPPALYSSAFILGWSAYFGVRYGILNLVRATLNGVQGWRLHLTKAIDLVYAVGMMALPLIFVITPHVSVKGHILIFMQVILVRALVVTANMFQVMLSLGQRLFLSIYCFVSVCLFILLLIDIIMGRDGKPPAVPGYITMCLDYTWFICLPLTTFFLPKAPDLRVQWSAELEGANTIGKEEYDRISTP